MTELLLEHYEQIDEANWGPWKLDRARRRVYIDQPKRYELDIADLRRQPLAATLWHLKHKEWADNECLGGLVRAAFAIGEAPGDLLNRNY